MQRKFTKQTVKRDFKRTYLVINENLLFKFQFRIQIHYLIKNRSTTLIIPRRLNENGQETCSILQKKKKKTHLLIIVIIPCLLYRL